MILTCCFSEGSSDRKMAIGFVIKFPVLFELGTTVTTVGAVVVIVALLVITSDLEATANGILEEFVITVGHLGAFTLDDVRLKVGTVLAFVKCTLGSLDVTVVNVTVAGREESGGLDTVTCGILPSTDFSTVFAIMTEYGVRVGLGAVVGILSGTEETVFAVMKHGGEVFGEATMVGIESNEDFSRASRGRCLLDGFY